MRGLLSVVSLMAGILTAVPASVAAPADIRDEVVELLDVSRPGQPVRCPSVAAVEGQGITGGCMLEEAAQNVDLTLLTAVGEIRLAECSLYMPVAADGKGTVFGSPPGLVGDRSCGAIEPCGGGRYGVIVPPSRGRLYHDPAGRLHRRLPICLNTWLGRFEGDIDVPLHLEHGEWWSNDIRIPVGLSGLAFNGRWRLKRNIHDRVKLRDKAVHLSVRPAR